MSHCELRDMALENRLNSEQRVRFNSHLNECADCRDAIAQWEQSSGHLSAYFAERSPDPSEQAMARLKTAAETAATEPFYRQLRFRFALAGAVLAAAVVAVFIFLPSKDVFLKDVPLKDVPLNAVKTSKVASSITYHQIFPETANQVRSVAGGERIQASKEGKVVRFQHSLLGLDATSKLAVTTSNDRLNQFELESGIVAAELPRIPNRESLVIRARFLTIRVTGTLFWVEIQDDGYMVIGVLRGHVSVTADEGPTWAVNADEQLVVSDNRTAENEEIARDTAERVQRLLYPEATIPSSPDAVNEETAAENTLEDVDRSDSTASVHSPKAFEQHSLGDIEQWILSKQFVKAERALKRRLKAIQDEPSSLNLLATCYRKQGKYKQAATEYERLATVGGVVSQNRARYTLSVIYQEKLGAHERAVEHLESYLDAPKDARPNTLEARLRLARSLKQLGRLVAYRQTLESIVASYPGTQAADKAKQLLVDAP